eukprot:366082-Chlamydomonas_euryale.AAC.5
MVNAVTAEPVMVNAAVTAVLVMGPVPGLGLSNISNMAQPQSHFKHGLQGAVTNDIGDVMIFLTATCSKGLPPLVKVWPKSKSVWPKSKSVWPSQSQFGQSQSQFGQGQSQFGQVKVSLAKSKSARVSPPLSKFGLYGIRPPSKPPTSGAGSDSGGCDDKEVKGSSMAGAARAGPRAGDADGGGGVDESATAPREQSRFVKDKPSVRKVWGPEGASRAALYRTSRACTRMQTVPKRRRHAAHMHCPQHLAARCVCGVTVTLDTCAPPVQPCPRRLACRQALAVPPAPRSLRASMLYPRHTDDFVCSSQL